MKNRLTIVRHGTAMPVAAADEVVVSTDELKRWLRTGQLLGGLLRYSEAQLLTDRLATLGRPLPAALCARLLSRGGCHATDREGHRRDLSFGLLAAWTTQALVEPFTRARLVASVEREVAALEAAAAAGRVNDPLDLTAHPVYVRADVSFGVRAGGSVGHTAGVINHLGDDAGTPIVLTTDRLPTVHPGIEAHEIVPEDAYWNYRELPAFVMNRAVSRAADRTIGSRRLAFVYQRYTLNGYAAIALARARRVPLVTEYNGSEVWVARHWGTPLRYEALSTRIEQLNLRAADLVSVVSRPLADEVRALGVAPERVLVNPNGVDPDRYHPDVDGSRVRRRYGLEGKTVIGFIGTFGPWHGAEVLAKAFVRLIAAQPDWRETVRVLFIGDGVGLPAVRAIVEEGGVRGACVFTGLVAQEQGAEHLAACDVLASPHVPNADGTPFFGSPTKLFEYMATGRGIVASNLDQIGEVLEDGRTALLVPPGDAGALASGLARLVSDADLRNALGAAARREVLARYTWREHVRRTVDALAAVATEAAATASSAASAGA